MYLTIAAGLLFLVFILAAPVKNSLKDPVTLGMDARELVEAHYESFNTLNLPLIEDSIDKGLGKGDINELSSFFVNSRVRMGYEGKSGIVSAREWDDSGRPLLEEGTHPYGTVHVAIQAMGSGRFRVNYEKWMPGISDELEAVATAPPRGYRITDLLDLEKQKKGNWLIVGRDRTIHEINP